MARPPTDIRDRIVRAARARFLREGVDGASMRGIAKDARTSLGMITYYFASKDELFEAVFEDIYEKLLADLEARLGGDAPLPDRLRATIDRLASASDVELEVVRLVAREAMVSSARREKILDRFVRGHLPLVARAVAGAQRSGVVDPAIPLPIAMIATMAMGIVPHIIRRAAGKRLPFSLMPEGEALTEVLLETLFRGIGPREPAKPAPGTKRESPPRGRSAAKDALGGDRRRAAPTRGGITSSSTRRKRR